VKATVQTERFEDINGVFDRMHAGQIGGASCSTSATDETVRLAFSTK
jgi:hypothetical protein